MYLFLTSADNLTKFLAVWGAILATFGLGWNLYKDLVDRPKLKVTARVRRIARATDGKYFAVAPEMPVQASEKLFVVMNVVNVGRRPVMWQGWGGKYKKRGPDGTAFFIVGQDLPKMLQEGESHSEMTELGDNLEPANDNVRKLYMWDPAGREYGLSRKQMKLLRKEARKSKT
jgi:hypothetical protein